MRPCHSLLNCWRSLTIWIYWEWHLILSWPLRSIFARSPELLLKDLVSWGSPGRYSMINCSSGDAFWVLSCQFWNTVLQCGVRLPIHTLNYWGVLHSRSSEPYNCMCTLLHLLERMWRRSRHQVYIEVRNKTITAATQRRITIKWLIKVKNNISQF